MLPPQVHNNSVISASSETQGLLAGTMRYFRTKVYFKSRTAPGNLFLPNQFQKWSNSVPLIGQKNFFFFFQVFAKNSQIKNILEEKSLIVEHVFLEK